MSAGGLRVRNGFRAAFCGYADRQRMLLQAEETILRQLALELA